MAYGSLTALISSITTGTLITAAWLEQNATNWTWVASLLRNGTAISGLANGAELLPNWTARAYNDANITHTNNGGWQTLTFNTDLWDSATMHSTSSQTDRFTMPVTGIYVCVCEVLWASSATGARGVRVQRNGSSTDGGEAYSVAGSTSTAASFLVQCTSAGQYVSFDAFQNSGGNLVMNTSSAYGITAGITWAGKAS